MTGKPASFAAASPSLTFSTAPSEPGTTGTPAAFMVSLATDLSPIDEIVSGRGPMNVRSWSWQIRANSAFSDRKP